MAILTLFELTHAKDKKGAVRLDPIESSGGRQFIYKSLLYQREIEITTLSDVELFWFDYRKTLEMETFIAAKGDEAAIASFLKKSILKKDFSSASLGFLPWANAYATKAYFDNKSHWNSQIEEMEKNYHTHPYYRRSD